MLYSAALERTRGGDDASSLAGGCACVMGKRGRMHMYVCAYLGYICMFMPADMDV